MTTTVRKVASAVFLVTVWVAASRFGPWPPYLFPGPLDVLRALGAMASSGALASSVTRSLGRLGAGYGLSLLLGVPLGLVLGRNKLADDLLGAPVLGLQSLPSICWLPVGLLWFGLSEGAILFVVVMGSALAVALTSQSGVRHLNPLWIRAARTMGARGVALYTTVLFPASLPTLLNGAKLGWTFAWRSLLAAELLYVSGGLGQLLEQSRELNDVARVFAVMGVILTIGLAAEKLLFEPLENTVRARFGVDRE